MPTKTPLILAIIAAVVAIGLLVLDLTAIGPFALPIGSGCAIPLWSLVSIYAALQFFVWATSRESNSLSDADIARWGPALERATPTIVALYANHTPIAAIAATLESRDGIPSAVTLRYIETLAHVLGRARPPSAPPS